MSQLMAEKIGKYKIVDELGRGAMGVVFVGHDPDLDRRVAVKVMAANIQQDADLEQRFRREAQAVARLQSPNIVTVYDFGYHQGSPYFVMELLEGSDLESRLRLAPPTISQKLEIVTQVCQGLDHAHQQGVVHRDIKPANLFVTKAGLVKIMDFGTARLVQSSQTQTGTVMGTVAYMSPEQLKGEKVDGRSDLFSLGVVLYRLLCHQQPFPGENIHNIIYRILHVQPASLALPEGSQVPPLQLIVDRALAKQVDRRYQTAEEMSADLKEFLRQHTGSLAEDTVFRTVTAGSSPPAAVTTDPRTLPAGGQVTVPAAAATQLDTSATAEEAADDASDAATVLARPAGGSTYPASVAAAAETRRPWLAWLAGAVLVVGLVAGATFLFLRQDTSRVAETTGETVETTSPAGSTGGEDASLPAGPSDPPDSGGDPAVPGATDTREPAAPDGEEPAGGMADTELADGRIAETMVSPPPPALVSPPPPPPPPAAPSGPSAAELGRREAAIRTALGTGSLARAQELLDEARRLAPAHPAWELFETQLAVAAANQRAQQSLEDALRRYDAGDFAAAITAADEAKTLFEQARLLDRGNMAAFQGSKTASDLRRDAELARDRESASAVAPPPAPAGRRFATGTTTFQPAGAGQATGFESDDEVQARPATRSTTAPGDLIVEISPASVAIGDPYRLQVRLYNESNSALLAKSLELVTLLQGRKVGVGQPYDLGLRRIDPGSTATLYETQDIWTEDLESSGELEVRLELARKGSLTKKITWSRP